MLGYREWRVGWEKGPILYSLIRSDIWPDAIMKADNTPTIDNDSGLHAYLPWSRQPIKPGAFPDYPVLVLGAVDAYGTIQLHEDGVIRAERARILALRVTPPYPGHHVAIYNVGVAYYCKCQNDGYEPFRLSAQEFEDMLLHKYGVPRLPDGVGPWPAPFGARQA